MAMRFVIRRASSLRFDSDPNVSGAYQIESGEWRIDISSLEELDVKLRTLDTPAVIYQSGYWTNNTSLPEILIYDDYIE